MRDGWVETTLGEVAELTIGKTPPRGEAAFWTSDLTYPFCTIADMSARDVRPRREGVTEEAIRAGRAKMVPAGSLLMSFKLTIGRIGYAGVDLFPNEAIVWIEPRADVDRRFLGLWLEAQDLEDYAGRAVKGKTLNGPSLRAIPVVIPPLAEQQRIVDLIAAVDATINAAERVLQMSTALVSAVENEHFDSTGSVPVTEVASFAGGYAFPDRFQGRNDGEIPVYKVSDMNTDGNNIEMGVAANYVSVEDIKTMRARVWPAGTVVFPKVGAALLTEKRRILAIDAAFDNNVMGLVPGPRLRPRYLLAFMRTVKLGEFAQHGAVPSVNQKHLAELCLHVPDLTEQDDLVALIEGVQGVAVTARAYAESLRSTRSALLSDLLSGSHEIPASYDALLEDVA